VSDDSVGPVPWQAPDGKGHQTMPVAPTDQQVHAPPVSGWTLPSATRGAWTPIKSAGALVLAQSTEGFAVYDDTTAYGSWPNTGEGSELAQATFTLHSCWKWIPYLRRSRFGYVRSARRIVGWAQRASQRGPLYGALAWTMAIIPLILLWLFITLWGALRVFCLYFTIPGWFVFFNRMQRENTAERRLKQYARRQNAMRQGSGNLLATPPAKRGWFSHR
jgi:hypothetical protein